MDRSSLLGMRGVKARKTVGSSLSKSDVVQGMMIGREKGTGIFEQSINTTTERISEPCQSKSPLFFSRVEIPPPWSCDVESHQI